MHSKIGKTKVLRTKGSLMKVESIAECESGCFTQVLLYQDLTTMQLPI